MDKFQNVNELTRLIIGWAIKVHTALGAGMLESAYHRCLEHALRKTDLNVESEIALPIVYDGLKIDAAYRVDLRVEKVLPVHHAQILSYLKLSGLPVGLLINFNVKHLSDGIKRFVF